MKKQKNWIKIEGSTFGEERALYGSNYVEVNNCRFEGEEDGESALKECTNVNVTNSYFALRYPFWHTTHASIENITMTESCRAAMWYDRDLFVLDSKLHGIKALRECNNVWLQGCDVVSQEFGWHCKNIALTDCTVKSEYPFMNTQGMEIFYLTLDGKYSFQYTKNVEIYSSELKTKDAFWHSKNVTVYNSTLEGEYLGWYSNGLTLVNCHIKGTQPLCYCKKLHLVNCTMENCDLAFENSDVHATITGSVDSIKNPRSGKIVCDGFGDLIITSDSPYPTKCNVLMREKQQ